jgi:hypothetical protein
MQCRPNKWSLRLGDMNNKKLKWIFILTCLTLVGGVVLKSISESPKSTQTEKEVFLRLNKNTGLIMKGFQYSQYHEGQKSLSIKAAKFSVEKKKISIFKLSPFKVASLKDAEIDFFGVTKRHDEENNQPDNPSADDDDNTAGRNDISFKGVLSQELLPPAALEGSISATCEPVKINLYLDDAPVTVIQAGKAIVDPRQRRLILRNNIQVRSGSLSLTTDRMAIYPETGLFEIENKYVLKKKEDETITGEKLTTDFFLEVVSKHQITSKDKARVDEKAQSASGG